MPIDPDTFDRLQAQYKRFDMFPEVSRAPGTVTLRTDAFLAFLEARRLILSLAGDVHAMSKGWRQIDSFFDAEPETPMVLLWAPHPDSGEWAVMMGYYDADEGCWYREGCGASAESPAIEPTKWMRVGDLSLPEEEFVGIERMR